MAYRKGFGLLNKKVPCTLCKLNYCAKCLKTLSKNEVAALEGIAIDGMCTFSLLDIAHQFCSVLVLSSLFSGNHAQRGASKGEQKTKSFNGPGITIAV